MAAIIKSPGATPVGFVTVTAVPVPCACDAATNGIGQEVHCADACNVVNASTKVASKVFFMAMGF